jgi:N-methylhydantoinase A
VRRAALSSGECIDGPALLEEEGSTTLVAPGMRAERHPHGSLIITTEAQA